MGLWNKSMVSLGLIFSVSDELKEMGRDGLKDEVREQVQQAYQRKRGTSAAEEQGVTSRDV